MKSNSMCVAALAALVAAGCTVDRTETMIPQILEQAREKFAPDRRTVVFDVDGRLDGSALVLTGEVHSQPLKELLLSYVREQTGKDIRDSVRALPDSSLGSNTYAVVSTSVINMRTKPSHAAELGTQATLGTPLKVLKEEDGWYYVQTPDDYLGWTDGIIERMGPPEYAAWRALPKVIVTVELGFVRQAKNPQSQPVGDVVAGAILGLKRDAGTHYEIQFPDGRTAFLAKTDAEPFGRWLERAKDTPETILATAKRFVGVPYIWGGTSAKGMDCSGFTKTVYYLNGVLLPRDADQQAKIGTAVDASGDMKQVRPGDLLFFGAHAREGRSERVTHVAISLGGRRFIHDSDDIRFNSLDPADPDYSARRERTFLSVRRIIGAGEEAGVRRLNQHPYYRSHERQ